MYTDVCVAVGGFTNSLVFLRKMITSTGFYWCCAPGASAPVVVKIGLPSGGFFFTILYYKLGKIEILTKNRPSVLGLPHIHICCRVKNWSKIWEVLSQKLVQMLRQKLVHFLFVFPSSIVSFGILKSQIVCRGANLFFVAGCRGLQQKVFERMHSSFLSFVLEKTKEKK